MAASLKGFSHLKRENRANLRAVAHSSAPEATTLEDWALADAKASAIPDQLWSANIRYIEGAEALGEFGINPAYSAQWSAKTKRKAESIGGGGWAAWGTTINGERGAVIYFKPRHPRTDISQDGKIKSIKYETCPGDPATLLLPYVDPVTAAIAFVRYKVEPRPRETFWQTVWRCKLPVAITEGFKKALCLLAHGIPAIALRGVSCWHPKGSAELYEAIADFATEGRQLYIIFDQDSKPLTIRNVGWEITKLGRALEAKGCKVSVPVWDGLIGKGVDDAIAGIAKGDRQDWLDRLLKSAQSFAEWTKVGRTTRLLAMLRRLNTLAIASERVTEGKYLPTLPELEQGAIHIVDSGMGSGKTTRISKDWVRAAIADGWNVLIIAPMNSLGQQTAEDCGLPHIRHFNLKKREQIELFKTAISSEHGVALCPDSEHRLPDWFLFGDRPLLVVMDECNQVAEHIAIGGTLKERQSEIIERHAAILEAAAATGAIVLSEAGITPRTIDSVKRLSRCDRVRLFLHRDSEAPKWDVKLCQGSASGFNVRLLEAIGGKKLIVTVSSQQAGERLERLIQKRYGDSKAVLRIDSETNEKGTFDKFWRNPNIYLEALPELPDILIISPSGKSGISIETPGFGEVWGYFSCHYPSMWLQQLGRYRPAVPRKVFCPAFINPSSGDEALLYSRSIRQRQKNNLQSYCLLYGIEQAIESKEDDEALRRSVEIQAAFSDFYADNQAAIGAEKVVAYEYLKLRLEEAGHSITEAKLAVDKEVSSELKEIQDQIWRDEAAEISASEGEDSEHDLEWARKALNGLDTSRQDRIRARKVRWRDEFPGIEFNDPDECYEALCLDYGAMRRGVRLQARAMNLEASKAADEERVRALFDRAIKLPHQLPKNHIRALLIEKTGLLNLLDGSEYQEEDPRCQAIKRGAIKWAREIAYWLRLQIKPTQTAIEICNKLLKKLGLDAAVVCRVGGRGAQDRVWTINGLFNPMRLKLLKASVSRLGGNPDAIPESAPPDKPKQKYLEVEPSEAIAAADYQRQDEYESEFLEELDGGSDNGE